MLRRFSSKKSKKSRSKSKFRSIDSDEKCYQYKKANNLRTYKDILFGAARRGDEDAIMEMFMSRKDFSVVDEDGNTALHLAAMNGHKFVCHMIVVLAAPFPIWKVRNKTKLTAVDLAGTDEVKTDLKQLGHACARKEDVHTFWNDQILGKKKTWSSKDLCVLSLDGGGARGFIQTQILLHLESKIYGNLMDYVDWIGGTSCGGILGLLLSSGYRLAHIRHTLFLQKEKVFCGNKVKVPKHNGKGIEGVTKSFWGEARLNSVYNKRVVVPVADSQLMPASMILFRNYQPRVPAQIREKHGYLDPDRILIWKAARCTSAAPYFFDSYNGLTDGGLVANNPAQAVISDFLLMTKLEMFYGNTEEIKKEAAETRLGCMISLGTGIMPTEKTDGIDVNLKLLNKKNPWHLAKNIMSVWKTAKNALQVLIKECTSSNGQPARYAKEWCHSLDVPYFRFTPELSREIPLDTTDLGILIDMLYETEVYLSGADATGDLEALTKLLLLRQNVAKCTTAVEDESEDESDDGSGSFKLSSIG